MITKDWRKPNLQPIAAKYSVQWLCWRIRREVGIKVSKRRMRRQLAKLKASLRHA